MAREKVKQVQVFSLPTEYERQAAEARRREMIAEMLAQQAYDPGQYQGAPIPKAAPVVKALEGYLRGREMRKAREAGEKAEAEVSRSGQQIMGRLMGGAPIAEPVMPDASGLDEVRVQSQYRASPDDAMRMAMTPAGSAAMRGNPALAAMLARTMEPSEKAPAPLVTGGMYRDPKTGQWAEIPGYTAQQEAIAVARRPPPQPAAPRDERIVSIIGADGKPTYVRESEAVGKTPFTGKTMEQEVRDAERARSQSQQQIDAQTALDNIGSLIAHPGRKAATGMSSILGRVPGTDAYDFSASLDTFKAQTFIPMVTALKGMGALSDAEGKKLQAAVGALDTSMSEDAFEKELSRVANTLYQKAKAAGLEVTMPVNLTDEVIELPPRR
jgi:hypothetical protein